MLAKRRKKVKSKELITLDSALPLSRRANMPERIDRDISETIGETPLVRLNRLAPPTSAEVIVKLESFNPLSSVKDRYRCLDDQ
jgi:pyridoxal-phosphate dependent enzyme